MLKKLSLVDAIAPPHPLPNPGEEIAFRRHFLVAGLRLSRVAPLIGGVLALSFWVLISIRVPEGAQFSGRQGLRFGFAVILLVSAVVLYLYPRFAIRNYLTVLGVPAAMVCVAIGLMSVFPPDVEHQRTTRLATAITVACWLMYGFTRLPTYFSATACVLASVTMLVGAAYHDDEYFLALVLYLSVANLAGWAMSVSSERRERVLFATGRRVGEMSRRLAASAVASAEASALKTQVLAAISHDLRQPLASMSLYLDSLEAEFERVGGNVYSEELGKIRTCLGVMSNNVERISEVSALQSGQSTIIVGQVDVRSLLNRLDGLFRGQANNLGVKLIITFPEWRRLVVESDEDRLLDVLSNLVSNALKYRDVKRTQWVVVRAVALGRNVRVTVRDNGVGVDQELHKKIFDEYFQVNNSARNRDNGYGLGLAIVKATVERLPEHRLSMTSKAGVGSRFDLFVPMGGAKQRNSSEPPMASSVLQSGPSSGGRLPLAGCYALLVEDDPLVRAALVDTLEGWGMLVEAAASPQDALDAVRRAERLFDVVVSDFGFGGAMDGVELIDAVRCEQGGATPAVILSGQASSIDPQRLKASEVRALSKPIDSGHLRSELEACLAA